MRGKHLGGSLENVFYVPVDTLSLLFDSADVSIEHRDSFYRGWWAKSKSCDSFIFSETFARRNYFRLISDDGGEVTPLHHDLDTPKDSSLIFTDDLHVAGYINSDFKILNVGDMHYVLSEDTRFQQGNNSGITHRIDPCNYKWYNFICVESVIDHQLLKDYGEEDALERGFIKFYISHANAPTYNLIERSGYLHWFSFHEGVVNLLYSDSLQPDVFVYESLSFKDGHMNAVFKNEIEILEPELFLKVFDFCDEKKQLLLGRYTGSWKTLLPRPQYLELYDLETGEILGRKKMPSGATAGIFICPEKFVELDWLKSVGN